MQLTKAQAAIPICFYSVCLLIGLALVIIGHVRIAEGGEDATCTCVSARVETVRASSSGSARTSTSTRRECNAKVSVELTAGGSKGTQDYVIVSTDTSRTLPDGCSCGSAPFSCWFASGQAWESESQAEGNNAAALVFGYVIICVACIAIATASILAMHSSGDDHHHQPYQMEHHHQQSQGYYQPDQGSGYPSTPHFAVGQPCGPGYGGYTQGALNY